MGTFFFFSNETNLRYFISSPISYLSRWVMLKTYYLHLRRWHFLILLGEMQLGPHASSLFNPIKSGSNPLRKLSRERLRVSELGSAGSRSYTGILSPEPGLYMMRLKASQNRVAVPDYLLNWIELSTTDNHGPHQLCHLN